MYRNQEICTGVRRYVQESGDKMYMEGGRSRGWGRQTGTELPRARLHEYTQRALAQTKI